MGKRTIRIPRSKILMQVETLVGKAVQVVMVDGTTHACHILSANPNQMLVEDENAAWTSHRRHQHALSLPDIHYIICDIISPW